MSQKQQKVVTVYDDNEATALTMDGFRLFSTCAVTDAYSAGESNHGATYIAYTLVKMDGLEQDESS